VVDVIKQFIMLKEYQLLVKNGIKLVLNAGYAKKC